MYRFWIVVVLCCAQPAWANGINLAWNECLPDGGTINRTSTCANEPVLHELVDVLVVLVTGPVDELVDVVVDVEVVDVVAIPGHAAAAAVLHTSLKPVPPAITLWTQPENSVQWRFVSASFVTV